MSQHFVYHDQVHQRWYLVIFIMIQHWRIARPLGISVLKLKPPPPPTKKFSKIPVTENE